MKLNRVSAVAASAVLLGTMATVPAGTAAARPTAPCRQTVGSITSGGALGYTGVTASAPPTAEQSPGRQLFTAGAAKVSSTWSWDPVPAGDVTTAYVVLGSSLYQAVYGHTEAGEPTSDLTRIGGGWGNFTAVEQSFWGAYPTTRSARYGLRADGMLFRWTNGFRTVASYPGFSAVKTMALISETKTYDTFLATTRGGALYTIRIPATTPMKPIVKQVRSSTWQGFEHLIAERCGTQSTLLTAIDKDTGSAYLYAVGHANGTATVIKGLGKLPGSYQDPVYSLHTADGASPLFGE
ncbi:hypothetical protein AB0F43_36110 [Kribbella sp. NPDC023972]|uniref:hypothetical protein n=1 Tax=Kribbella sp. NPDC023972 TaxID=3154795 RepID=UPI0033EFCD23